VPEGPGKMTHNNMENGRAGN